MTLKQALELALKILKQVMEEKLNSSNVEVSQTISSVTNNSFKFMFSQRVVAFSMSHVVKKCLVCNSFSDSWIIA